MRGIFKESLPLVLFAIKKLQGYTVCCGGSRGLGKRSRLLSAYGAVQPLVSVQPACYVLGKYERVTSARMRRNHQFQFAHIHGQLGVPARPCCYGLFEKRFSENTRHNGFLRFERRMRADASLSCALRREHSVVIPKLIKSHDN